MAFPLYLAMTATEIQKNPRLPAHLAYMACHFSPYSTGLSNPPTQLPGESLLMLNDRTPICGHDPEIVVVQLCQWYELFDCSGILLDFQRPNCAETAALTAHIVESLPCPVAVSEAYAAFLPCPVLLQPVPLDIPITEYLLPWNSREIWLEVALDAIEITLTPEGCQRINIPHQNLDDGFYDEQLHCHYRIQVQENQARFTLFRTREDLDALLQEAERLGVTRAVGLWQELI